MQTILVTGGAGYIGSHTLVELIDAGYTPVVYDNFSNSQPQVLQRVEQLTGQKIAWIEADILDKVALEQAFSTYDFYAVIHFAGLKAVGESVAKPLWYYQNNVTGTLNLLEVMAAHNVKRLIFSSSATVYGDPQTLPIQESSPRSATNPYGQTKLTIEYILADLAKSDANWRIISLRYFNPIGAHSSGQIGEDPNGIPNNLMPYISQVAVGRLPQLQVFGDDYDTVDGTGVRDYIHVVDLAKGHVAALDYVQKAQGFEPINLGTGQGTSVKQLIDAFVAETGQQVPYSVVARRAGDVASCYASADKAKQLLGWQAQLNIDAMCRDSWRWQSNNPQGYV